MLPEISQPPPSLQWPAQSVRGPLLCCPCRVPGLSLHSTLRPWRAGTGFHLCITLPVSWARNMHSINVWWMKISLVIKISSANTNIFCFLSLGFLTSDKLSKYKNMKENIGKNKACSEVGLSIHHCVSHDKTPRVRGIEYYKIVNCDWA